MWYLSMGLVGWIAASIVLTLIIAPAIAVRTGGDEREHMRDMSSSSADRDEHPRSSTAHVA